MDTPEEIVEKAGKDPLALICYLDEAEALTDLIEKPLDTFIAVKSLRVDRFVSLMVNFARLAWLYDQMARAICLWKVKYASEIAYWEGPASGLEGLVWIRIKPRLDRVEEMSRSLKSRLEQMNGIYIGKI